MVRAPKLSCRSIWVDAMRVGMKHGLEFIAFWKKEGNELGDIASGKGGVNGACIRKGTKLPT